MAMYAALSLFLEEYIKEIAGNATLTKQTMTLSVLKRQLWVSTDSSFAIIQIGMKEPSNWRQKPSEPGCKLCS
jgi:hypothetical protein